MMEGLFNGNGQLVFMIGVLVILVALFFILVWSRFKRYSEGAKAAGNEIMTLAVPKKTILTSAIVYIFIAFLLNGHGISSGGIDMSSVLVLVIGVINISFDMKPQVICDNGIVTTNGLISWEMIEEVTEVDEKGDVIKLKLRKMLRENNDVKIYCPAGETLNVVRLIENRMKKEEIM